MYTFSPPPHWRGHTVLYHTTQHINAYAWHSKESFTVIGISALIQASLHPSLWNGPTQRPFPGRMLKCRLEALTTPWDTMHRLAAQTHINGIPQSTVTHTHTHTSHITHTHTHSNNGKKGKDKWAVAGAHFTKREADHSRDNRPKDPDNQTQERGMLCFV